MDEVCFTWEACHLLHPYATVLYFQREIFLPMMPRTQPWTLCASAWCTSLTGSLDLLRQRGVLCDTSLKTSDGILFTAHSVVLAASSPYLASILEDAKIQATLEMDFSSKAIEQLLLFIYSGKLFVESWPLLTEVGRLAEVLQLDLLTDWCKAQEDNDCDDDDIPSATSPHADIDVSSNSATSSNDLLLKQEVELSASRQCSQTLPKQAECHSTMPSEQKVQENSRKSSQLKRSRPSGKKVLCKTRRSAVQTDAKSVKCQECGKTFSQRSALWLHGRCVHQNLRPFKCSLCGNSFNRKHQLQRHQSAVHALSDAKRNSDCLSKEDMPDVELPAVPHCGRVFPDTSSLQKQTHGRRQLKTCTVCGGGFRNLGKHMTKHKRENSRSISSQPPSSDSNDVDPQRKDWAVKVASSNANVCQFCGKMFKSLQSLKNHEKKHFASAEKLDCDSCGLCFKYPGALRRHKSKHHQGQLLGQMCDICGGVYQHVNEHRKIHDENRERKYQCSYCDQKLTSKANLTIHERYHTGEKPYKCRYCEKAYYISAHRHRHELSHRGERAFACEVCGKRFLRAEYLKSHMQIHSILRPHKCDVCGSAFKQREVLRTHQRIHDKEASGTDGASKALCAVVASTS